MLLPENWDLPPQIRNSFSERTGRQRVITHGDHTLISLHWIPKVSVDQRIGLYLWRNPEGSWYAYRQPIEGAPHVDPTQPDNQHSALKALLREYDQVEDALERQQEKAHRAEEFLKILREVITIQHAIRNTHETLESVQLENDDTLLQLRDYAYEIRRSYDLLQGFSRNELEIYQAQQAEEGNRKANQLNLIAAFTLPLTALASIFGMEVANGAVLPNALLFWLIVALGLVWGWGLWMYFRNN